MKNEIDYHLSNYHNWYMRQNNSNDVIEKYDSLHQKIRDVEAQYQRDMKKAQEELVNHISINKLKRPKKPADYDASLDPAYYRALAEGKIMPPLSEWRASVVHQRNEEIRQRAEAFAATEQRRIDDRRRYENEIANIEAPSTSARIMALMRKDRNSGG